MGTILLLFCAWIVQPKPCEGSERIPDTLLPGIEHLYALVDDTGNHSFDAGILGPILDFVCADKAQEGYTPPELKGWTGAYIDFPIETTLARLIRYAYNPEVPAWTMMPNSVRLTRWTEVEGAQQPLPRLWEALGDLGDPIIVRGIEHEVITPDENFGGYYAYDLDRTLILYSHDSRQVLISLARQRGRSQVGEKGVVVGEDRDWTYFYSGIKGLTPRGLGWVDSHIDDSFSITLYVESPEGDRLTNALFKWMGAGWFGLDMITTGPVERGLRRYASSVRETLESAAFPEPETLATVFADYCSLSDVELRGEMLPRIHLFRDATARGEALARREFSALVKGGDYLSSMTREEMIADLMIAYVRKRMGKN